VAQRYKTVGLLGMLGVIMLAKWKFGKLQKTKTVILEANL
jgi:hypothetical protein